MPPGRIPQFTSESEKVQSSDAMAKSVATTPEMGDEGRLPPALTGAGGKLRPEWLKQVVDRGSKERPYMLTRMPRFGANNLAMAAAKDQTGRLAYFSEFIEEAKASGLVQRAIESAGERGARVAPLRKR